ncbi:MAG: DNA-3-methyladenine glycosylase 2 family protein [Alphaproteobacteria bacterium]|nr:DNA-3-methyladenine glycosylase 2 family protein [Alphaproteobacteria bacterium]
MTLLSTKADLSRACEALAAVDADMARALEIAGSPPLRRRPGGFAALLQTIMGQQLSIASARAIWDRLAAAVDPLTPEGVLALDDAACRTIGLSRQKQRYAKELAMAVAEGRLDFRALPRMDDEAAIDSLVQVTGIGRWTAEIYLLFALRRADIWPVDDLAVVVATQRLKRLPERPDRKAMAEIAAPWRPWRSAAALMMWHFYRKVPPGTWQ